MSILQNSGANDAVQRQFSERGVAIVEHAFTADDLAQMDDFFPRFGVRVAGARADGFSKEGRSWLADHVGLQEVACRLAGARCALTRLQAFDKSPLANWFVPWHQDRAENGCERPVTFLEKTLALRIHLDACGEHNGPLEVISGSHRQGRLTGDAVAQIIERDDAALCLAERGDIVAIRPLLLHRSQRAKLPAARRVIHIEYTRCDFSGSARSTMRPS